MITDTIMNNKITLIRLAQLLAARSGLQRKECEDLLRSFFQHISDALEAGDNVKVKGFGTFKISQVEARMSVDVNSGENYEIPPHSRIVFLPSKELASVVNRPFGMFETIELDDRVEEDELRDIDDLSDASADYPEELHADDIQEETLQKTSVNSDESPVTPDHVAAIRVPEEKSEPADEDETLSDEGVEEEPVTTAEDGSPSDDKVHPEDGYEEEPLIASEEDMTYDNEDSPNDGPEKKRRGFGHGFFWGIVAALLVIAAGVGVLWWLNDDFGTSMKRVFGIASPESAVASTQEKSDASDPGKTVLPVTAGASDEIADMDEAETGMADIVEDLPPEQVVPTKPSDPVVYDTVTKTRVLRTMANKYYGNPDFWPYIYEENKKILGHPNRIRPGTRVVIPSLSKYGVDPTRPADIEKARKMDREIYARYK